MSSKSSSTRQSKTPLNHLKSKKWCFPPSPLRQSSASGSSASGGLLSPSKSPEPNCAICLGKIEDKSFTDRCFHCFCRLCLFEWAKVKAECPVCRQAFEKIIFNIRAMDDYDEQVIQTSHRHRFGHHFHSHTSPFGYHPFANLDGNQRFRYPTTLTPLRRRMMDFERRLQLQLQMSEYSPGFQTFPQFLNLLDTNRRARDQRSRSAAISNAINNNNSLRNSSVHSFSPSSNRSSAQPIGLNERHRFRGEDPMISGQSSRVWSPANFYPNPFELDIFPPPVGTSAHRRYIYDSDLWVLSNGDGNTSRTREASACFFSSNPACTHRLIPWLNRELNSILSNPSETETLIPRIMNALLMYDITSVGFKKIIVPFTTNRTNHFIHEFFNFARSPYDIEQYTRISVYVPRHRADIIDSEPLPGPLGFNIEPDSPRRSSPDSMSSGSSIEILNEPFERISSTTNRPTITSPQSPTIYSIDGSDTDVSSTDIRRLITPSPVNTPTYEPNHRSSTVAINDVSSTSNPTPVPRGDLPDVNFGNINIIDDFDNPKPGTSGLSRLRTTAQTKWTDSETTDVDVGDELEAAIARFENHSNVKQEIEDRKTGMNDNNANHSDISDCSSVLIVGYVKPLHERTPEFVDLITSGDEEVNQNEKQFKSKRTKKDKKHRKRSSGRSRSKTPSDSTHSHSKRKCKHKSRDRSKDKDKHKHKSCHRIRDRSSSSSSSSSSSLSSSCDELKQLNKTFKKRHKHRKHGKYSSDSKHWKYEPKRDNRLFVDNNSSVTDRKDMASATTSTTSSSRPSSLSSVVIAKQPMESQSYLKAKHYYIYSDSE